MCVFVCGMRGALSSLLLINCVCVCLLFSHTHKSFTNSANLEAGVAAEVVDNGGGGGGGAAAVRQM